MKVVHIFWSLGFGGIETMLINIANEQASQNADVNIIIINDFYEDELIKKINSNVKVHLLHRKCGSRGFLFVLRLNFLLYKIAPDIIHLHMSKFYTLLWGKKLRHAAVATLHALARGSLKDETPLHRIFPILSLNNNGNVIFLDKIPKVFSISQSVKDDLYQRYGINSTVVSNGIMAKSFAHRPNKPHATPLSVVMVSRLDHKKKGQDLLIKATAALQGKIHVTLIGDGDSKNYLSQLARDLNASPWVQFLGAKTQAYIQEHLCKYDLFVQPSRREGFGLTVAEAMATKIPVLVSEGQGPAEVTCGSKYGWIFKNGSVDDLIKKIDYISSHYEEALSKSEEAYQYVCNTYDVSITAKTYLDLYKKSNL